MKKHFWTFFLCSLLVLSAWLMRQNRVHTAPQWLDGTPKVLDVGTSEMSGLFAADDNALIYWRIYKKGLPAPNFIDFTNTDMEGVSAYGGGFLKPRRVYTNRAVGLAPNTEYVLYAACLFRSSPFWRKVEALPFKTEDGLTNE